MIGGQCNDKDRIFIAGHRKPHNEKLSEKALSDVFLKPLQKGGRSNQEDKIGGIDLKP